MQRRRCAMSELIRQRSILLDRSEADAIARGFPPS